MAKVKDYLQDILKQIEKQNESNQSKIERIEKELSYYKEFNTNGLTTEREIQLQKALDFLKEQESQNKNVLNKQKQKELTDNARLYFRSEFIEYVEKYKKKNKLLECIESLQDINVINEFISDYKKEINNFSNIDYLGAYYKALGDIKKLYAIDIKNIKELAKIREYNQKMRLKKRKSRILRNIGIIGLLSYIDKKF